MKIKLLLAILIGLFALTASGQSYSFDAPARFNSWITIAANHAGTSANRIVGVSAAGAGINGNYGNYIYVGTGLTLSNDSLKATGSTATQTVTAEYFTTTDSTFAVPNNVGAVITKNATHQWVSGTITLPSAPANGQIISIYGDYGAVTVAASAGKTLVGAPTAASVRGAVRFRYRTANTTWYPY
jgi:hypothetical protein